MLKMRRIVGALLLTAVIVADTVYFGDLPGSQETSQALLLPKLVEGHKVYYENGDFKGCETGGTGCWMLYSSAASIVFTASSEGVHIQ